MGLAVMGFVYFSSRDKFEKDLQRDFDLNEGRAQQVSRDIAAYAVTMFSLAIVGAFVSFGQIMVAAVVIRKIHRQRLAASHRLRRQRGSRGSGDPELGLEALGLSAAQSLELELVELKEGESGESERVLPLEDEEDEEDEEEGGVDGLMDEEVELCKMLMTSNHITIGFSVLSILVGAYLAIQGIPLVNMVVIAAVTPVVMIQVGVVLTLSALLGVFLSENPHHIGTHPSLLPSLGDLSSH